jgi:hypothetical protein
MNIEQLLDDVPFALAKSAFHGTSHDPERRAHAHRNDYAQTMVNDYAFFEKHAQQGDTVERLGEVFERYREGYASRFRAWLRSHGRCISWFIVGPSSFPTARAARWRDAADRRMAELISFRNQVRIAATRELRPDLRPIMSGNADAMVRLAVKLEELERIQTRMKQANAAIRKHRKAGTDAQVLALVHLGYSASIAATLLKPDACGRIGFADYQLQNNGANLRSTRARLAQLERNRAKPVQEVNGAGVRIEDDPPAHRVRLFFDSKPDAAIRNQLKSAGFRWTPTLGAWQGYRNDRIIELARTFVRPGG